jgi:hypothetical protein
MKMFFFSSEMIGTEHTSNSWLPFKVRVWRDPKTGKLHTQVLKTLETYVI